MIRLEARSLSKVYGTCTAVNDVSLDFAPGQIHAVLGENGAGKSTLMKLLFGLIEPSSGQIFLDGRAVTWRSSLDAIAHGLGMVQQHFTLVETLSVIDNIMMGAEVCSGFGRLDRERAIELLTKRLPTQSLALPWHSRVADLSVGEKQRLEILKLLFRDSRILFLDEPTAVLTPAEIEEFFAVLRELKAQGRTVVLITHKINEVLQVCDTYAVLRHGELKARGQVREASVETIVESMIGRKLPEFMVERKPRGQEILFSCRGLSDETHRLRGVDLRVHKGEIVGIAGVECAGQSQLVDILLGLEKKASGEVSVLGAEVDSTVEVRQRGLGLVPEDRLQQGLWREESCAHNMAIGLEKKFFKYQLLQEKVLRDEAGDWAKAFDLRAVSLEVSAGSLSGGNQQKLIFAREVLGRNPRFLICHQPTRGVDLGAIDLIHRKITELRNSGLGVLLISSELDELLKLCDRLYVFFSGRVSLELSRSEFERSRIGEAMTGVQRAQ